ncbi:ABC transporter, partial [Streptosporangium algeriense]
VRALADGLTAGMHEAWQNGVREAARSHSAELPRLLSAELSEIAPRLDRVPVWWRLLLVWQYLLVLLFLAGIAWLGTALAYGVFEAGTLPPGLEVFGETASMPWVGLMIVSVLGLGLLTAVASRNVVMLGAGNERDRLEREMRRRVGAVASAMVIEPVERELVRYNEFYSALRGVRG